MAIVVAAGVTSRLVGVWFTWTVTVLVTENWDASVIVTWKVYVPDGGFSCSCNIAPLCRKHHRVKTHTAWTYVPLERGSYLWTSPHGLQFLRDHTGTLDVSADKRHRRHPDRARPPDE